MIYALLVDKNGAKLKPLPEAARVGRSALAIRTEGHLEASNLPDLARILTGNLDRPVLDMTGIQGAYDIQLDVSPGELRSVVALKATLGRGVPSATAQDYSGRSSISAALRDIGLRIEGRRAPMEQVIVESGKKLPTANSGGFTTRTTRVDQSRRRISNATAYPNSCHLRSLDHCYSTGLLSGLECLPGAEN